MDIEEVKLKRPIEKIADDLGISLIPNKESPRYSWAVCPFHNDHNPSFVVDKFHRSAHCWTPTCVAYKPMDHIRLIQLYEHLSRDQAMDRLYQLAGEDRPINSLHEILERSLNALTYNMDDAPPKEFFRGRGIRTDALKELSVGYSPSFDWFKNAMIEMKIPMDEAAKLELFRNNMFENAIIYPLFDGLGRMSGFRSRPLGGSFSKYIANLQDYPLKSSRVYGMHLVRNRQIVLLEGPNDVLAFRSLGIRNAGGLMGVNLRDIDNHLINHGFSDVVFIGDGDDAGKIATLKAPDLVRVNTIPFKPNEKVDPDEYARDRGIVAVSQLINDAKFPFEVRLESRLSRIPSNITGKIMMIKDIAHDMSEGLHPIIIRKLQDKIASSLEIPLDEVESIFDLADFDTSTLERKIVWHMFARGELHEDIKVKVNDSMLADPRLRKQFQMLSKGLSPTDNVDKSEGLTAGDLDQFLDLAKRKTIKRLLKRASYSISNLNEPLDDSLNRALTLIAGASSGEVEVYETLRQLDVGINNAIERSANPDKLLGFSFGPGFKMTDDILQGLRPNAMCVLAATQGTGKSALALEWGKAMAFDQDIPVLWISLEMSELDMSIRILSKLTRIPATRIMRGNLTDSEIVKLSDQAIKYSRVPFYTAICGGMNIHQIVSLVRKYKALKGIQAVFIDYIQLIEGGSNSQTMYERVGHISRMIKSGLTMDKSIALPVVAIAQLSRIAAKSDLPGAEHIAESYKIAQDADMFITLARLKDEDIADNKMDGINMGNMIMYIDKNRAGIDKQKIGLIFDRENLAIREVVQSTVGNGDKL